MDPKKAYESVGLKFPGYTPEEDKKWGKKDDAQPEEQKQRPKITQDVRNIVAEMAKGGTPVGQPPEGLQAAPPGALEQLYANPTPENFRFFVETFKYIP